MFYPDNAANRQAWIAGLNTWYARATNHVFINGAWPQLHANGTTLLYNCGGITPGGGYGNDYVSGALYQWISQNLPAGYVVAGGPVARGGGAVDAQGRWQFLQDYYTITRAVHTWAVPAGTIAGVAAASYQLVLNFHIYVGGFYANPAYTPPKPPPPPAPPPPPLNLDDLNEWPPL